MAKHNFVAGEGSLWAQINGPNTKPVFMGCHLVGDIDQPEGDVELIYCVDPSGPNRFQSVGSLQGAAGPATTTITTSIRDTLDTLERARCPFTLYIMMSKTGRKDVFANFDRAFVMENVRITNRGLTSIVARTPEDQSRSDQTFDVSAERLLRILEPSISRISISETSNINDITFCNDERCRTDENVAQDVCELGYAVTDSPTGSPSTTANVLVTTDGGTWTATATDPFAAGEDIIAVECFDLGRDTVRVVVARGTTDGGNPAEVAYSDDQGTTWVAVEVGSIDGQFVPSRFSLFALDRNTIFAGMDDGYIYKSEDAAISWTAVEAAIIHSGGWNAIKFIDEDTGWAVGDSNVIARTVDGGTSWSTITGPTAEAANDALCVEVLDQNRAWVGYSSGNLYYTLDAGVTWSARAFTGSGSGEVRDIKMFSEVLGFMVTDNASPVGTTHWTVDGGYTWSTLTTPTNSGLNVVHICDEWTMYAAGEAQGGTGYIAKGVVT